MRFFSSIVLLFAFSLVYGQGTKVLVQNTRGNRQDRAIVQVKWYSQNLIYPDGVNVYRRQVGETAWTKINAAPVVLKKNITPQQKQQDQDFEAFVDMASNLTKAKNAGFIILNVFAKTFQSEEFSKQIGIQFDDSSVRWGSDYEYRITRLEKGAEIEFGISPQLRVGPYQPSAAVKEFKADLKEKAVKMMWKPEADRFYGVNVYRSTSLDTARKKLNATPIVLSEHNENAPESDALFQDTDLKEGVTYFYDIAGLDFFSQETVRSERIEVKVGDLTPPPPPENLTKSVKVLNVRISWTTVHTVDLVGFYVYRSTLSDGPFIKITSQLIPKEDSVYVDPVDQPGFFYYHVASVDEAGNNGMSNPILAEVQDVIPPLPPQQVTATADTGKVTLRWKRNREPDLKGYYVFRSINEATTNFLLINAEPVRDTVFVQVLPENAINTFVFKVMAVDTSYNRSGYSAVVSAKLPDITSPIKPLIHSAVARGDTVTVQWITNPESDLAGFNLYRYPQSAPSQKVKTNTVIIDKQAKGYSDTISLQGRYYYQLEVIDLAGNASPLSDPFPFIKNRTRSFQFADLTGQYEKRKKQISLQWSDSREKSITGFIVYKKGPKEPALKQATALLKAFAFQDKQIEPKTEYSYQIRAYFEDGDVVTSPVIRVISRK